MLAHYGAWNVGKRERCKQVKVNKMEDFLLKSQGKLKQLTRKSSL